MSLKIRHATRADLDRLTAVHLGAFDTTEINRALFGRANVGQRQEHTRRRFEQHFIDQESKPGGSQKVLLVAVLKDHDSDEERIVSFAQFAKPVHSGRSSPHGVDEAKKEHGKEEDVTPLAEGTNVELALGFFAALDKHGAAVQRERGAHWTLGLLATDPEATLANGEKVRGAGKLLLGWGQERARADKLELHLESTREAFGFYEKYGFRTFTEPIVIPSQPPATCTPMLWSA